MQEVMQMPDLKLWGEQEIHKLRSDMDRLFDSLCSELGLPCMKEDATQGVSITQDDTAIYFRVALPGFKPENVELTVHDRSLVLVGRQLEEGPGRHSSRTVQRQIVLPCRVRPEQSTASFHDDMLEVRMPKDASCRPMQLRITRS